MASENACRLCKGYGATKDGGRTVTCGRCGGRGFEPDWLGRRREVRRSVVLPDALDRHIAEEANRQEISPTEFIVRVLSQALHVPASK